MKKSSRALWPTKEGNWLHPSTQRFGSSWRFQCQNWTRGWQVYLPQWNQQKWKISRGFSYWEKPHHHKHPVSKEEMETVDIYKPRRQSVSAWLHMRKWRNSVKNAEAYSTFASVGSDHRIVSARIKLSLRKSGKLPRKKAVRIRLENPKHGYQLARKVCSGSAK